MVFASYEAWRRADIDDVVAPYLQRPRAVSLALPPFGTEDWWACMTSRRVRNHEHSSSRRTEHAMRPDTVAGLPVEEESDGDQPKSGPTSSASSSDDEHQRKAEDPLDAATDNGEDANMPYPTAPSQCCGRLPLGVLAKDFCSRPPNSVGRSAEARYAREYDTLLPAAMKGGVGQDVLLLPPEAPVCQLPSNLGAKLCEQQLVGRWNKKNDATAVSD